MIRNFETTVDDGTGQLENGKRWRDETKDGMKGRKKLWCVNSNTVSMLWSGVPLSCSGLVALGAIEISRMN